MVLENSMIFEGRSFGRPVGSGVTGELVFTTGMTGYLETLTDPGYHGQIVVQTFPMIGNYGVIPSDFESSRIHPKGYIVREWCENPSNFRSEGDINALLSNEGIVGLCGVDTREITGIIRESGSINGVITSDPDNVDMDAVKRHVIRDAVAKVSTREQMVTPSSGPALHKVVMWDFGAKRYIAGSLAERGCEVVTVPHDYTAEQIAALKPDGLMLCNGPGDPADNRNIVNELRKLTETGLPMFGVCLGHQILALAMGAKSELLKHGHRGANQPVRDNRTGNIYITTQNHGYTVLADTIPDDIAEERYTNANDGTCEGLDYKKIPAFSVQFHPDAITAPLGTAFLFDRFTDMMEEYKDAKK